MAELSTADKLKLARVFANAHSENIMLRKIMGRLVDAARTSGGVAGRDTILCAACDEAEAAIADAGDRGASSVSSSTDRPCAKCGCETKGEAALVDGEIWCHPCADGAPLSSPEAKSP